jgi:hypothetical protein
MKGVAVWIQPFYQDPNSHPTQPNYYKSCCVVSSLEWGAKSIPQIPDLQKANIYIQELNMVLLCAFL